MLIILVLLYIQTIFCYNVTINSINIPKECVMNYSDIGIISKSEVFKTDEYTAFYCRKDSDICVYKGKSPNVRYVNFPNEKGNIKPYIASSCIYKNNKIECLDGQEFKDDITNKTVYCSYRCSKDSDCLHNKCIFINPKDQLQINNTSLVGYCAFNNNSPITQCESIYKSYFFGLFDDFHIHCGKLPYENCTTSEECSSEVCRTSTSPHKCSLNYYESSKNHASDSIYNIIAEFIFYICIIIIICICLCCVCVRHNKKQ